MINMKALTVAAFFIFSFLTVNAQEGSKPGLTIDKHGVEARGKKGGHAGITKHGAAAKGSKGKGVEADKQGTRTTPKK